VAVPLEIHTYNCEVYLTILGWVFPVESRGLIGSIVGPNARMSVTLTVTFVGTFFILTINLGVVSLSNHTIQF